MNAGNAVALECHTLRTLMRRRSRSWLLMNARRNPASGFIGLARDPNLRMSISIQPRVGNPRLGGISRYQSGSQ